ncbi:hypothetical protein [Clostridium beijerinckii]|uniref:Uncharacterized protein n=2 Tax=Clostridium beijerinckii TaxID=1520 RepID=A0AAW3W644_CLOBE|nr:hypothetical protein [Clostridium beijerinckii]MBC2457301.1 hypothetical protein [Clostridium beijerinckii]MBC2474357.1 hypothetical protein [Clostridium beijerinckii]NOV59008.1 hypothetical protein [Clostridium beijerinckii]NOV71604.1 hypothetical protein [Clostridium beijerinckii]NOW32363.1 hypothetical protein [Clostridium beijerinckii]
MKYYIDKTMKFLEKTRKIYINNSKFEVEIEFCNMFVLLAIIIILLIINAGLLGYVIGGIVYR